MPNLDAGTVNINYVNYGIWRILCEHYKAPKRLPNPNEGITYLCDDSFSIHNGWCKYCEALKDFKPKCETSMRVLQLCMMLVLMYILCFVGIVRHQKISNLFGILSFRYCITWYRVHAM
jgi:hypothetical protein